MYAYICVMRKFFRIIKRFFQVTVITIVALLALLYIALSLPVTQRFICNQAEKILSETVGVPVTISQVKIMPFNRVEVYNLSVPDHEGNIIIQANKVGAGIDLIDLIFDGRISLNNIQLFGLDARITRETPDSPTNIQFIIDAFTPKEKREKKPINLDISSALIRRSKVSYDILSEPHKGNGMFDSNHIAAKDITASISIKELTDKSLNLYIKRLSLKEQSGLQINRLTTRIIATPENITVNKFELVMPRSDLNISQANVHLNPTPSGVVSPFNISLTATVNPSKVTLSDISAFAPVLRTINTPISISTSINGPINDFEVKDLKLAYGNNDIVFATQARIKNILRRSDLSIDLHPITLSTNKNGAYRIAQELGVNDPKLLQILQNIGSSSIKGDVKGGLSSITANMQLNTQIGDVQLNVTTKSDKSQQICCNGYVGTDGLQLSKLLGEESELGMVAFSLDIESVLLNSKLHSLDLDGSIDRLDYKDYSYNNIDIDGKYKNNRFEGFVELDDPNGYLSLDGKMQLTGKEALADVNITCRDLDLGAMHLMKDDDNKELSFDVEANYTGNNLDNANGYVTIKDISYGKPGSMFVWEELTISADNNSFPQHISISSDYINGSIEGSFSFSTIIQTFKNLAVNIFPTLFRGEQETSAESSSPSHNRFDISFIVNPNVEMANLLNLPFTLTDSMQIDGFVHDVESEAMLGISAPNMWIGRTHMEDVFIKIDQFDKKINLQAQTSLINLDGNATNWKVTGMAQNDNANLNIHWNNNEEKKFNGDISLSTQILPNRQDPQKIDIATKILPSKLVINDSIWNIRPASVLVSGKDISVSNIDISRPGQRLNINGAISNNPQDTLHVALQSISLDYIFETLNIPFVDFGGDATGRVDVADLYGESPYIRTKELNIKDFSYNSTTLGDLSLYSMLNMEDMGILLKGIITADSRKESYVDGYIYPTRDSLSIAFDVDRIPLAFIEPFLQQIVSDVDGAASGNILLAGTFVDIYIEGEALAHNASFTVPFLNTNYHFTDSVFFDKDCIRFNDITAYDKFDNSAQIDGYVRHNYFRDLDYYINIHDTDNMLVFDLPRTTGLMYYGTIFGTGQAIISGSDFNTDVAVNMTTDPGSDFTFAITSTSNAIDYSFLTFTNKREKKEKKPLSHSSRLDSMVIENNNIVKKNIAVAKQAVPLNLSIEANITPDASITLVMNDMTGDNLIGNGEGVLRLEYNTIDNEVGMYGNYVINSGKYNFSIEDIITRKFTITPGSQVGFQGDPLKANLDIEAIYTVQANLADLDQSFSTDGELARTTVPVNTILDIEGELTKPNIGLNIELPTLSADSDHKMRSIISTTEMLNQQIIYLLVLNRFYTPEYNVGQNANNELSSIAASTLSSSLGSLMSDVSNTFSISPNLRSDRGDFSDIEFDLFFTSNLMDNRLLFSGNLGYRNSQYSTTNFIGDFEVEYLLNKSGNFRFFAYNHFNDRNYTMRTALTTQGIGLMYKHDFNSWKNFFEFTSRNKKEEKEEIVNEEPPVTPIEQRVDTVLTTMPDILE